jgi:hypothetical protein
MRLLRLFVPLAFLVACDLAPRETSSPAHDQWEAMMPKTKERIAGLRNRQVVVGGRVAAVTIPPGVNDPVLSQMITDLQTKVGELEASLTAYENTVSQMNSEIDAAVAKHDKIGVRKLVDAAGPRLDEAYATAGIPFDALDARLPEAEAASSRYLAQAAAEEQRMVRVASEGGDVTVAVKWNGTQIDVADVATKSALDRLVKLATACDALRMSVSSGAVAQYVVAAGVPADHVVAGKDPAAQNAPAVKITVTSPCLPPTPPPPPPGAGAQPIAQPGAQPGMPPPPTAVVERVQPPAHPN